MCVMLCFVVSENNFFYICAFGKKFKHGTLQLHRIWLPKNNFFHFKLKILSQSGAAFAQEHLTIPLLRVKIMRHPQMVCLIYTLQLLQTLQLPRIGYSYSFLYSCLNTDKFPSPPPILTTS